MSKKKSTKKPREIRELTESELSEVSGGTKMTEVLADAKRVLADAKGPLADQRVIGVKNPSSM